MSWYLYLNVSCSQYHTVLLEWTVQTEDVVFFPHDALRHSKFFAACKSMFDGYLNVLWLNIFDGGTDLS